MSIKKISRKKAYTIAALIFIAVIVFFLWRDLNLAGRVGDIPLPDIIVENIDDDYLKICYYNLYEKYLRGQKDFSENIFSRLNIYINNRMVLK